MCEVIKCHIKLIDVRSMQHKNSKVKLTTNRGIYVLLTSFIHVSVKKLGFALPPPVLPCLFSSCFTSVAHSQLNAVLSLLSLQTDENLVDSKKFYY